MPWFQKLCRNAGLMIHNITSPSKEADKAKTHKHEVSREVTEKKVDDHITLRKTTIEEVEMKPGADPDKLKEHNE